MSLRARHTPRTPHAAHATRRARTRVRGGGWGFLPFCFSGLCVSPVVMSSLRLSSPSQLRSQNAADATHAPTLGHRSGIWQEQQKNGFSSLEKPVLLEFAVRHRPAQRAAGLCSRMPLLKAIGARPRRVHGAQRTGGSLAGGGNTIFTLCATQAHTSARPAAPSRGTRHKQTTNTHAARRQLFSQIAGASCARSRGRASSAGSEGAARRAVRRGAKDREHARTANRDKGKRTSLGVPARRVRRTSRRVRRAPVRGAHAPTPALITPRRETIGSSRPQKALLKLRKARVSQSKQLRRAVRLWFVCVF